MDAAPTQTSGPESPEALTDDRFARWGVLRHKHFRTFWLAALGSYMGTWFEFVGTQWIVAQATKSTLWASALGAAQLLPTLFLGLLGGVVADRVNRRTLLIVTQTLMMLIAIAFAVVVALKIYTMTVLLLLTLAQGLVIVFNNPAWQVMIPRLVPREDLTKAITMQGISFNAARAIGPALAGFVMAWKGPEVLFAVNAVSFIGVLAATFVSPDAPAPLPMKGLFDLKTLWFDTRNSVRTVASDKGLRAAMLASIVFAMFATPVLRFLPLFVSEVYGLQEATFGILTGIMGAGAVFGGFAMRIVPTWYPKHHFIPLSVMMGGLWIFLFSLETNVWVAGVFMFFVGLFWMWAFNSSMAAMQMLVEDSVRGRVLAVCNTAAMGLMPLGAFAASLAGTALSRAVKLWSPRNWDSGLETQLGIAFVSLVLVGAGIVMLIWRTPEVDGLAPGQPGFQRRPGFVRGVLAWAHKPTPAGPRCPECNLPLRNAFLVEDTVLCPRCEARTPPAELLNVRVPQPLANPPTRPEPELAAGK
ncbi:MAG: MFS transporter [Phycisphaerales bacterium]